MLLKAVDARLLGGLGAGQRGDTITPHERVRALLGILNGTRTGVNYKETQEDRALGPQWLGHHREPL